MKIQTTSLMVILKHPLTKLGFLAIALAAVAWKIHSHQDFGTDFLDFTSSMMAPEVLPGLLLALVLAFLNFCLESLKWRLLVREIQQLSFWQALRGVLTGMAGAFLTVKTLGDFLGRSFQLKSAKRFRVAGALLTGGVGQSMATWFWGGIGLYYFGATYLGFSDSKIALTIGIWAVLHLIGILLLMRIRSLAQWLSRWPNMHRWLETLATYTPSRMLAILMLSHARYLSFFIQLWWLVELTGEEYVTTQLLAGISLMYLAKSALPQLNLFTDLGIREFSALYFLEPSGLGAASITGATLLQWLMNILLPSLVGLGLAWRLEVLQHPD